MRTWKTLSLLTAFAAALCSPAAASAAFEHVVAPGESLSSVAAADGLSVSALAAANGVSPDSQLIVGSSVVIPAQGASAGVSAPSSQAAPATATQIAPSMGSAGGYLVQPGDTLSSIAARYGVSIASLASANGLDPAGVLVSGTTISVSGAPAAPAATTSSVASDSDGDGDTDSATSATAVPVSTTVAAAPSSTSSSAGPQPTSEMVSPSEVGSIAAANGVPASLAEAIGYQESGFNNGLVSSTGATGVMQIEPGTWNYIGQNLASPPPLSTSSAADNIRGGVLLLHSLLNQTGGNAAQAAAAYYQGLQSVQQHGMYSDTQQYVNNVLALQQKFGGG
ncbi:MAG: LysM peptidoglycan-binding domain-containing protein [Solirubrobacteraceae bacterium]